MIRPVHPGCLSKGLAGTPPTVSPSPTSSITTAPAPMVAPDPIERDWQTVLPMPIHA
jgi:hypothetical protein